MGQDHGGIDPSLSYHGVMLWSGSGRPVPPWLCVLGIALLSACPSETETDHENVGGACLRGEQDQAHQVSVDFGLCLSSSCDELVRSSCSATVDGDTITIEALATVRSQAGRNVSCTADCGSAVASCETPPLAAGTYTLVYAGRSVELTVPIADETACTATTQL